MTYRALWEGEINAKQNKQVTCLKSFYLFFYLFVVDWPLEWRSSGLDSGTTAINDCLWSGDYHVDWCSSSVTVVYWYFCTWTSRVNVSFDIFCCEKKPIFPACTYRTTHVRISDDGKASRIHGIRVGIKRIEDNVQVIGYQIDAVHFTHMDRILSWFSRLSLL